MAISKAPWMPILEMEQGHAGHLVSDDGRDVAIIPANNENAEDDLILLALAPNINELAPLAKEVRAAVSTIRRTVRAYAAFTRDAHREATETQLDYLRRIALALDRLARPRPRPPQD